MSNGPRSSPGSRDSHPSHAPRPAAHRTEVRVRYAETDRMGVAYYANTLVWFEVARTELMRALGFRYRDLEDIGCFLPVGSAEIRWLAPAHYDDHLLVDCWVDEAKSRKLVFGYEVRRSEDDVVVARGCTTQICVDRQMQPKMLPDEVRAKLGPLRRPT